MIEILKRNVLERQKYPSSLKIIVDNEKKFFQSLKDIENEIILSLQREHPYWSSEQFPKKLGMCGYSSSAIVEFLRKQRESARVVYGHYKNQDSIIYHYWTSTLINDEEYCIDATYGQFDPNFDNKILIYPYSDLKKYKLSEYKKENEPVLKIDIKTLRVLAENGGILPMRDHIKDDLIKKKYQNLVDIFNDFV